MLPLGRGLSKGQLANWVFLIDSLNFNFWTPDGQPKYTVNYEGKVRVCLFPVVYCCLIVFSVLSCLLLFPFCFLLFLFALFFLVFCVFRFLLFPLLSCFLLSSIVFSLFSMLGMKWRLDYTFSSSLSSICLTFPLFFPFFFIANFLFPSRFTNLKFLTSFYLASILNILLTFPFFPYHTSYLT